MRRTPGLAEALRSLREILVGAARDGFAAVADEPDLGETLRGALDRVEKTGGAPDGSPLSNARARAAGWEGLSKAERRELIAEGLRLCASADLRTARRVRERPVATGRTDDSVAVLPGAGPATCARLVARGLSTVADLLSFVPRGYDDLRVPTPIAALAGLPEGTTVLVHGLVSRIRVFPGRLLDVYVREGEHEVRARWFRVPGGMAKQYERGLRVALAGPLRKTPDGDLELVHPSRLGGDRRSTGIRPRYPAVEGVPGRVIEKLAAAAVDRYAETAGEVLPESVRRRLGLPSLADSLRLLHRPDAALPDGELDSLLEARSPAHRRLALEDLIVVQLGLAARRGEARSQPGRPCRPDLQATLASVRDALPFSLTGAQSRAIDQIAADLAQDRPMQRLLQGDVGSGKTAVVFAAAALAAAAGGQALIMAPTEILAEQHGRTLSEWGARTGLRVAVLTASTRRPERETTLALARVGRIQILVGTQVLLDARVALPDLALAVIDEQHRFGVAQRARLRERGAGTVLPHLLVLTATPIPRTLALTLYGDLDLTVLDELPTGRRTPETRIYLGDQEREQAYRILQEEIAGGRRAFVVCPVLVESTRPGAVTAVSLHEELGRRLAPISVGLVHGQMDAREKEHVLRAFRDGEVQVLVATTIVEVGLDVPEAALMIVEEADRFGMAQLHQLRGRVGRGRTPGRCLLLSPRGAGEGLERLRAVASTSDGLRIAEADLRARGHGELFGVRQAGMPRLRFADLASYADLLEAARSEAGQLLEEDPRLAKPEHGPLRAAVEARWSAGSVFGEEAG